MVIFGLLLLTAICALNWLNRYISSAALIYYMQKKQYKLPSDEEIKECTAWAVKQILNRKSKGA